MEPEFIVDEEPSTNGEQLREAILAAIQSSYNLRQNLAEKELTYQQAVSREVKFLRDLIAIMERRCTQLINAEQSRLSSDDEESIPDVRDEKKKWLQRVEGIQKAFDVELSRYGVTPYIPSGQAIPERDDIRDTVAATGQDPGTIIKVIKPGYLWRGELLRPAEVLIAE